MVQSMMSYIGLSPYLWGYALQTVAYLLNKIPLKSINKTPYEICNGKKANISYLKIWRCNVYVKHIVSKKL